MITIKNRIKINSEDDNVDSYNDKKMMIMTKIILETFLMALFIMMIIIVRRITTMIISMVNITFITGIDI